MSILEFMKLPRGNVTLCYLKATKNYFPSPFSWIKFNIHASFANGKAALAFVVRDENDVILHFESKIIICESPFKAETFALEWPFEVLEKFNWDKMFWSFDITYVVNEVLNSPNSGGWNTCYSLILIRMRFNHFNRVLNWNPR